MQSMTDKKRDFEAACAAAVKACNLLDDISASVAPNTDTMINLL